MSRSKKSRRALYARTPAEIEAWKQRWLTEATLEVIEIVAALRALDEQIWKFLGVHGDGCDCSTCSASYFSRETDGDGADPEFTWGQAVEMDLKGFAWALEVATGGVSAGVVKLTPEDIEEARQRAACSA